MSEINATNLSLEELLRLSIERNEAKKSLGEKSNEERVIQFHPLTKAVLSPKKDEEHDA